MKYYRIDEQGKEGQGNKEQKEKETKEMEMSINLFLSKGSKKTATPTTLSEDLAVLMRLAEC
jgi:hypothetical protein